MATNVGHEYINAEKEYHDAKNSPEKLKALKNMLTAIPKHKGTEKMQAQIKKQIAKMTDQISFEKKQGKGSSRTSIKKEGAGQCVIFGRTNSGKSTLLKLLSGKDVKISEYEYTTQVPIQKMISFENVKIQGIEIPGIYDGFYESKNGRSILSLARIAEVAIIISENKVDFDMIKSELEKSGIFLTRKRSGNIFTKHLPYIRTSKSKFDKKMIPKIWKLLDKIRVQTKTSKKIAKKPIVLESGSRVEDVARAIHQDFVKNFRYARLWGPSSKFDGQQVGLEHVCKDGDIVEIFTK